MTFKNVDFSEFVNFYFNVSSADEITTDDEMKNFLISRYNEKVTLQIYDGKFTPFARVIFADGETLDELIERPKGMSDDDYKNLSEMDSFLKELFNV